MQADCLKVIHEVNNFFMTEFEAKSAYDINNGMCEEWAYYAMKKIGDSHSVEIWETIFEYADTTHIFLCVNGLFCDAECPEGIEDFMLLPIFKNLTKGGCKSQPVWRIDSNGKLTYPNSRINFTGAEAVQYYKEVKLWDTFSEEKKKQIILDTN